MTFAARRISAISCSSLIIRHPAETGVALDKRRLRQRVTGAIAELPAHRLFDAQGSRRDAARTQSLGNQRVRRFILFPRQHLGARAQRTVRACSRARSSSNFGVTRNALPSTGMITASKRSPQPPPHFIPVK